MDNRTDGPISAALALRALARWGDRVAFDGHGGRFTYRQGHAMVARMQAVMDRAGMKRGDSIAVLHANRGDAWMASTAAGALGLRTTPLHPRGSLEDHRFVLEDAEIDYLLVDADSYAERCGELAAGSERLKQVFTLGPAPFGQDLLQAAEDIGESSSIVVAQPDDLAWIAYTGGTTGKPKGVMRNHRALGAIAQGVLANFEWPETPVYLAVAPNSHVGGTKVLPTLIQGGRVHCAHGFDPGRVLDSIGRARVSVTLLVPTMVYLLLDDPGLDKADLSSLELLLYGASPMSPSRLREGLDRVGPVFSQLYGQTEGYPISVLRRSDHQDSGLFASCGHPCSSVTVALMDDDDAPVPAGEVGEICVRAPHVMGGYWKREEETAATLANGWLHTGDMAHADDRGYLHIVDRKKDMIISGGFNVYPREIEDILSADPTVRMAAVIGVPDEKWGEAVKAIVVPRGDVAPNPAALIRRVREAKGAVHAPKSIEFAEEIPLTPIGKPDKKALRATYWQDRDRQVG